MAKRYDCIVVGAGAAGLLATATLRESGRDVVVLEARNRVGGRAHSIPMSDGSMVESGATLVTGPAVATWEFIVRLGLRTHRMLRGSLRPAAIYDGGRWLESDPVAEEAAAAVEEVLARPNPDTVSFREALVAAGLTGEVLEVASRALAGSAPMAPDKLSARNASEVHYFHDTMSDPISGVPRPGNPNFVLVDGYTKLWEDLSRPIADAISFNRR